MHRRSNAAGRFATGWQTGSGSSSRMLRGVSPPAGRLAPVPPSGYRDACGPAFRHPVVGAAAGLRGGVRRHAGSGHQRAVRGPRARRRGAVAADPPARTGPRLHAAHRRGRYRFPVSGTGTRAGVDRRVRGGGRRGPLRGSGRRGGGCASDGRVVRDGAVLRRGRASAGAGPRLRAGGTPHRRRTRRGRDRCVLAGAARRRSDGDRADDRDRRARGGGRGGAAPGVPGVEPGHAGRRLHAPVRGAAGGDARELLR